MWCAQLCAIAVDICELTLLHGATHSQVFHLHLMFTCGPLHEPSCSPFLRCVVAFPWPSPGILQEQVVP